MADDFDDDTDDNDIVRKADAKESNQQQIKNPVILSCAFLVLNNFGYSSSAQMRGSRRTDTTASSTWPQHWQNLINKKLAQ